MLKIIKGIFVNVKRVNDFLKSNIYKEWNSTLLIFACIFAAFSIGVLIYKYFENWILMKVCVAFLISYIYFIIPFAFFSFDDVRKYFFFGEKCNYMDILNRLDIISYLFFVFRFSMILVYPVMSIPFVLKVFNIDIISYVMSNIDIIIIIIISLNSIFWFAYHIIFETVPLSKIKIELTLYVAVASTLIILIFDDTMKVVISNLIISYFWIQYLISLKEHELEQLGDV